MLQVLARVLDNALGREETRPGSAATSSTQQAHAKLARDVKALLSGRFQDSLTVAEIAAELYISPYHLCRVFREQTGQTIHRYRNQLRLRVGLDYILNDDADLTTLALELGYASHSHFTRVFRKAFDATPSSVRRSPSPHLRQLSKNLTA